MFLIAPNAQALARWDVTEQLSQEAEGHEVRARIENSPPDFHRQVDTEGLFTLKERPYRHGRLRRRIGSVSQRMLTRTLRNLESTGLIARRVIRSKAIAVEYSLTQLGRTIIAPLRGMCRWARRYRKDVSAEVHLQETYQTE